MDIDLGTGMDGTEAAQRILSEVRLPLVFLTGHTEKEYVDRVRNITSYGYVIKLSARRLADEGDGTMHVSGFVVDETDQREIEHELRQSNRERDSIVQLTQELIVRHDEQGRWTFVNDRACEFFGRSREELIGEHFINYVHPEDVAATESAGEQMTSEHSPVTGLVGFAEDITSQVNAIRFIRARRTGKRLLLSRREPTGGSAPRRELIVPAHRGGKPAGPKETELSRVFRLPLARCVVE
jgi:PAS domain-containing protein